jgi:uncharacterized protein YijF (DUF1287 family)
VISRRVLIAAAAAFLPAPVRAETPGERLARAARSQLGVTTGYDPAYRRLAYPGGDPPRSTGVCADVVVRAGRDGLGLDLQRLIHEDMVRAFASYPSRRVWGLARPDPNIDHRRVLNLEAYWRRRGSEVWRPIRRTAGADFPEPLALGDCLTWLVAGGRPHIGVVVAARPTVLVVHNIGWGAQEIPLASFSPFQATGHYRWPAAR